MNKSIDIKLHRSTYAHRWINSNNAATGAETQIDVYISTTPHAGEILYINGKCEISKYTRSDNYDAKCIPASFIIARMCIKSSIDNLDDRFVS